MNSHVSAMVAAVVAVMLFLAGSPSLAQNLITNADIQHYAQVVLAMEPHRLAALEQYTAAANDVEKAAIRREFLRTATRIIEEMDMTVTEYNQITMQLREDLTLKGRIEEVIREQQL